MANKWHQLFTFIAGGHDNSASLCTWWAKFMADTERGQELAVPHCSFDLADAGSGIPRQSIEVGAFVFY